SFRMLHGARIRMYIKSSFSLYSLPAELSANLNDHIRTACHVMSLCRILDLL
uniref:Uncharacterized protein n=1 Tax=Triticum urartu TaxID=4572 RepID=A0A8R7QQU7_TRIUA